MLCSCCCCCCRLHAFLIESCRELGKFRLCTCEVHSGTVGGPPVGEEEESGLHNPWGCGPPIVSSSISSIPTTKIPSDSSPHYLPISVFTLLQTERRWRDLLSTRQEGHKSQETNRDSLYVRRCNRKWLIFQKILVFVLILFFFKRLLVCLIKANDYHQTSWMGLTVAV